jgi:drug/metabolite transporter (DMT)-like permease
MIEAWIPITIAAAFFQNLRSALQKHLKGKLSNTGAAYARFFYAVPFALLYVYALNYFAGYEWPKPNATFYLYCLLGGLCQIMFTVFLLWMFSFHSFAVGTTFSKLEVVTVAIFGALLLGDGLSFGAILAIAISVLGLLALSIGQANISWLSLFSGLRQRSTLIGIICAAWLGGSVIFYRGASLSLEHDNFIMSASFTLAITLVIQTVVMGIWLLVKEQGQLQKVIQEWRWAGAVGVTGMLASVGWFTAFTIQNASYVRALGQIELLFTFIATTLFFREKVTQIEIFGILFISSGILLIIFVA